jgi:DNA-binding transcriptional LysR family regulator
MKLNLRQIEVFRAIMVSGTISGAAKLLYVSQPAVSRLLSHTEQRLGLLLFDRINGRLYPTPEARRLFNEVTVLYQSVQRVNDVADNLVENRDGQLRLACSPNLGQSLLPRALASFCRRYPDLRVVLHTLIPSVLQSAILTHQVELGVAYMPLVHPSLQSLGLFENRIVAVLPKSHRLAKRSRISTTDLMNEHLISYSSDIPLGQLVRGLFGPENAQPKSRIEVQQAHVACAMVQAGAGVALVDELTVKGPVWSNVVTLPVTPLTSAPIKAFYIGLEPLSRLAREFIAHLQALDPDTNA